MQFELIQVYSSTNYAIRFSYFEFKIRLIRLGLSFQKKFLYSQLRVGHTEKISVDFSHA